MMYLKVLSVLLVASCSLAYPRTYQEQRQIYYTQPIPVHQRLAAAAAPQLYLQQQPLLQVPAATSLLPNNVNSGVRYGQHQQVVYVVPSGAQIYYEEQGPVTTTGEEAGGAGAGGAGAGGGGGGGYVDSFVNLVSSYYPFGSTKPTEPEGGAPPAAEAGGATGEETKPEKAIAAGAAEEGKPPKVIAEKPEKLEQVSGAENLVGAAERLQQQQQQQQQHLYQYHFDQQHLLQRQQEQQFQKYLALRNQQFLANRQPSPPAVAASAIGLPASPNLIYYKNPAQSADYVSKRPAGAAAIAFQRYLTKSQENNEQTSTTEKENESEEQSTTEGSEHQEPPNEDLGPSIAQAKPQAVSVAGFGGVAAAAPIGTAIVGPGGMALSAPSATAVAGAKPKPPGSDKLRTSYFPRNSAASAYYPF